MGIPFRNIISLKIRFYAKNISDCILKMAPKGQTVEQKRAKALTWFKKQKTFFHMKVFTALTIKVGCVFQMVIQSEFRTRQYKDGSHREGTPV